MIYLIDTIGNETGMNLYNKSFHDEFAKKGKDVKIISNYHEDNAIAIIQNFYHGNFLKKINNLFVSIFNMTVFLMKNHGQIFIYQSFGLRIIDMLFLLLFIKNKKCFVIVHDVYEITDGKKAKWKYCLQRFFYSNLISNIICHSNQAIEMIKATTHFNRQIIYFPHFSYNFCKDYIEQKIVDDIKNAIDDKKNNFLFFGQIRLSKGIDILIEAFKYIERMTNVNIIIAGVDKKNIMENVKLPNNVKLINRYIENDELNYLFDKSQFVILPYKEIYQSGVLETVVYFQKYAILSGIYTFKKFIERYPSFGCVYSSNTPLALAQMINSVTNDVHVYKNEDMIKYKEDHDVENLIRQMLIV